MKSTELRIGNYCVDADGNLCKIVSIHENGRIRVELPNIEDVPLGSFNVNFAKGIPLTEEILLKCGFEQDYMNGFEKDNIYITIWKHEPEPPSVSIGDDSKLDITIHFIHQLQNLYFALTGEELNIEL